MATVRARHLGIRFDGEPGHHNAITDVGGIEVGHVTVVEDRMIEGTVSALRTGVTVIHPQGRKGVGGVAAGRAVLNGTGEWSGMHLVDEIGQFFGPIALTGTANFGVVHAAVADWGRSNSGLPEDERFMRLLPVVAETLDFQLNDIFGEPISRSDVIHALEESRMGPVDEGNVGGGTGMVAYEFKGGIGTASRIVTASIGAFTVGVLLQANHARRGDLRINGVPVGRIITDLMPRTAGDLDAPSMDSRKSSLIIVIATDAPLAPHQLCRMARRAALGIGRNGSTGNNLSGEMALAFSTANVSTHDGAASRPTISDLDSDTMNALFAGAVQCVEEALVNQLVACKTMHGTNGATVFALPHDRLLEALKTC
ncbi:MAG: beta-peptidyl aminopeptidase [Pseudomonadota bacterium]|jgi:L-aminopeptidase/D-esterase-like protein